MVLALSATAIVIVALLWEVALPRIEEAVERHRARRRRIPADGYDPGASAGPSSGRASS